MGLPESFKQLLWISGFSPEMRPREPAPPIDPNYRHPAFPNADARLRPVAPPVILNGGKTPAYQVTPETFPALYETFARMEQRAGIAKRNFRLILSDSIAPHVGETDFGQRTVTLRLSSVQLWPWDRAMVTLGHEMGHAWRDAHPKAPHTVMRARVPASVVPELEADLLGVCLTHDAEALKEWLRYNGGHGLPKRYPTNTQDIVNVDALRDEDCPMLPVSLLAVPLPGRARQK